MRKLGLATALLLAGLGKVALAADFNGDGTNDVGVFRESNGLWAIRNVTRIYFGTLADQPLPGDYNGDGEIDFAVFRPSNALWAVKEITRIYYGSSGDQPLIGIGVERVSDGVLWTRIDGGIYYPGTVGIGTNNPMQKLTVAGSHNLNPSFPDGLCGTPISYNLGSGDYTVPPGKTLYITNALNGAYGNNVLRIGSCFLVYFSTLYESKSFASPIIAGAGEVVNRYPPQYSLYFNGILLDEGVTPVSYDLGSDTYVVPPGKILYLTNALNTYNGSNVILIGVGGDSHGVAHFTADNESKSFACPIIADEGHRVDDVQDGIYFNGYLADR